MITRRGVTISRNDGGRNDSYAMALLDLEIQAARDKINCCFEEADMTVQEHEVIFYYYFEGMSNEEVVEVMNYSGDYM